uniref:Arginine-hydroxylase NDUFAF5, mitochondrial n=1 Tax=Amblyomma maculatum TaxID=34609 RepID=G3MQC7_AMBMU
MSLCRLLYRMTPRSWLWRTCLVRRTDGVLNFVRSDGSRCLSSLPPGHQMNVFDRNAKTRHRTLAAQDKEADVYDYLKSEVGYRLADRVYDIKRKFARAVELGCGRGYVSHHLDSEAVESLVLCDSSQECLTQCKVPKDVPTTKLLVDEEFLPFAENSVDIFLSSLSLHWVNNLPSTFKQVWNALKQDGAFLGCVFGGDTLYQLRGSLQLAETEREGGFGAHISPFVQPTDLAALLNQAGFVLLTIDSDDMTVNYPTAFHLMKDLKGMAENNATWKRKSYLHRDSMVAAAAIYQQLYGKEDGTIPATFHILSFIGWKPHPSQAKPAKRGSQNVSLKDLGSLLDPAKKT